MYLRAHGRAKQDRQARAFRSGLMPQRLVARTPDQEPDGAAILVIVIARLRPLFVGQFIADGVNAVSGWGRTGAWPRSDSRPYSGARAHRVILRTVKVVWGARASERHGARKICDNSCRQGYRRSGRKRRASPSSGVSDVSLACQYSADQYGAAAGHYVGI